MTTATTTPIITILRTSQRGAHLITDGSRVVWVMGRSVRPDGSLTPSGLDALANADKTYAQWQEEEAARELWRTDREAAKEKAFQEGKEPTSVSLPVARVTNGSDKAWKVRTNDWKWLYGKQVSVYNYLPKSVVSVEFTDGLAVLTMPKWFLNKNRWLNELTA